MSRRLLVPRSVGWIVLASLSAIPASASRLVASVGQAPASGQPPVALQEPTGTGRITVLVVAADNGAPVKRAHVVLNGMLPPAPPPPGTPPGTVTTTSSTAFVAITREGTPLAAPGRLQRDGDTEEAGRVEFAGLPAASYSLFVSPPAGFVRPTLSESVQLRDGDVSSVTIKLVRGGAITGRVLDEGGDPLSRASVRAILRDRTTQGMPRLSPVGMPATTDDRGQFRIYDLAPADYFVVAALPIQSMPSVLATPAPPEPKVGYLPTFYPGAGKLEEARAVNVKSAQDTAGIDFGLLRGVLGRVTGTALDSTGSPMSGRFGGLSLVPKAREHLAFTRPASLRPDGTFVIPDVPPGEYYLSAWTTRGAEPSQAGPMDREGAFVPVTVAGDEVSVSIRTNAGATLSGRVVREGPMPPPSPIPGRAPLMPPAQALRVSVGVRPPLTSSFGPAFAPGKSEYFDEDGTFTVTGVRGSVMLTASSGVGAVKSMRRGATDLLGATLDLTGTEKIDDIEIVLTTDTGWLTGMVTDSRGHPVVGAWVLVFSEDSKRWSVPFVSIGRTMGQAPGGRALQLPPGQPAPGAPASGGAGLPGARTPPRGPGQFTVSRIVPGRYLVAVVEGITGNSFPLPDYDLLASLRPKAIAFTVGAGETATVNLKVGK